MYLFPPRNKKPQHLMVGFFHLIDNLSPIDNFPPLKTEQHTPPRHPGSSAFLRPLKVFSISSQGSVSKLTFNLISPISIIVHSF